MLFGWFVPFVEREETNMRVIRLQKLVLEMGRVVSAIDGTGGPAQTWRVREVFKLAFKLCSMFGVSLRVLVIRRLEQNKEFLTWKPNTAEETMATRTKPTMEADNVGMDDSMILKENDDYIPSAEIVGKDYNGSFVLLSEQAQATATKTGFPRFFNKDQVLLSMVVEVGQLGNAVRWLDPDQKIDLLVMDVQDLILREVADIAMYGMHLCRIEKISFQTPVNKKTK